MDIQKNASCVIEVHPIFRVLLKNLPLLQKLPKITQVVALVAYLFWVRVYKRVRKSEYFVTIV